MKVYIWSDGAAMPNGGPAGAGYVVVGMAACTCSARNRSATGRTTLPSTWRFGTRCGPRPTRARRRLTCGWIGGGRRPPHWGIACAGRAPDPAQEGGRSAEGPVSRGGQVRSDSQGAERSCRRAREERRAGLEGAKRRSAAIGVRQAASVARRCRLAIAMREKQRRLSGFAASHAMQLLLFVQSGDAVIEQ